MEDSKRKLELICTKWMPLAQEYAKFLNRYKLDTLTVVTKKSCIGYDMGVYADGEKYLKLVSESSQFVQEEKQLDDLFGVIEALYLVTFCDSLNMEDEDIYYDTDYDEY